MDAWIDCLTSADQNDGMLAITAPPGDVLTLQLEGGREFGARCPEIYKALIECTAFVNWRRIDVGERPILALSYR